MIIFALIFGLSPLWLYVLVCVPILSAISFTIYGYDKWKAKSDKSRIPEASLHLWDVVGGWPGGIAGQKFFRHKTVKLSFQIKYWCSVALNLAIVYVVYRTFYG